MFFSSWFDLWRVIAVGIMAYLSLVALLRISGKRTLSKMSAFDLVVTVALGSTLATVLLSKDVSLAEGVTALALLIALQFVITWLAVRSKRVEDLVKSEPALLYFEGCFLKEAMRRERITEAEVRGAVRSQGLPEMEAAAAVVLETDGVLTVMKAGEGNGFTSLEGINRPGEDTFGPASQDQ